MEGLTEIDADNQEHVSRQGTAPGKAEHRMLFETFKVVSKSLGVSSLLFGE